MSRFAAGVVAGLISTTLSGAAAGVYEVLKAFGKESDALIVSVDGGRQRAQNVAEGVIGATSMRSPLPLAALGIDAIGNRAETGAKQPDVENEFA